MPDEPGVSAPVHLPDPTPWPMVLALGMTLLAAGLVAGPRLPVGALKLPLFGIVGLLLFGAALFQLVREDIRHFARGQS